MTSPWRLEHLLLPLCYRISRVGGHSTYPVNNRANEEQGAIATGDMRSFLSTVILIHVMSIMMKVTYSFPMRAGLSRAARAGLSLEATSPDVPSKRRFSAWGEGSDRSSSSQGRPDSGRSSYERPDSGRSTYERPAPSRNIDGGEYSPSSERSSGNNDRSEPRERSFGNNDRSGPREFGRGGGGGRGGASSARTTYQRDDAGGNGYSRGSSSGYQGNSYNRDNSMEENREPPCGYFEGDHLYGISPIRLAVASGRRNITELLIQEGMELSNKKDEKSAFEILKIAKEKGIPIREFPKHDLNMLTENRPHQGFVLRAAPLQFTRIDGMPVSEKFQCVLALDEVWDPQNFGALLRTSHFLGVDKVVVCAKNSAPLSPTVSKASSGALEIIEVSSTDNMMRFLDKSQENGWQVIGTSLGESSMDLEALPLTAPTILVLGNEGHGVRTNILRRCTHLVKILGMGGDGGGDSQVDSLNVSVTGGIMLHHILKAKKSST